MQLIRVNRVMLVSLCADTIKPVFEGGMHQFIKCILVSRITGEDRVDFLRACGGPGSNTNEPGGRGRAEQLNLCVEAINPLMGQI